MTPRLILAILLAFLGAPRASAEDAPAKRVALTIAVADFKNRHPLLDQDWICTAAPDLLGSALARAAGAGVLVLDRTALAALAAEQRLTGAGAPARGAVATHVIGGSFSVSDGTVQLEVALTAVGKAPSWTQRSSGPVAGLAALVQSAARGALASLDAPVADTVVGGTTRDLPVAAMVTLHRGREAARRGDHARALADLLRTCKLAPGSGEAWLLLGTTCEALGRPAAAMAAWEQAMIAAPEDAVLPAMIFRLAKARENQPDQRPARRLYQRLVDDFPFALAPPEFSGVELGNGEQATFALLAARRLATLGDAPEPASAAAATPPAASAQAGGVVAKGATQPLPGPARPLGSAAQSPASAQLIAARLRQLQQLGDLEARKELYQTDGLERTRLSLLALAGGWPAQLPAARLVAGEALVLPLSNNRHHVVVPPPGQVIEQLTVSVAPGPGIEPKLSFNQGAENADDAEQTGTDDLVEAREGGVVSVAVPAHHAQGFITIPNIYRRGGDREELKRLHPALSLTAKLRPCRPGTLWIVTQPPRAYIWVDGVRRGVSPCLIRDLPPGRVALTADTLLDPANGGLDMREEPLSGYQRFRGEAAVTIAGDGETRVDWTLSHQPLAPSPVWSRLRLVAPAILTAPIDREPYEKVPSSRPCLAAHPRLGWVAAWMRDGDIVRTSSPDGRAWAVPSPLPVNSPVDDEPQFLAVAPGGQVLLVFVRALELYAAVSDDFATWSPPVELLRTEKGESPPRALGARWDVRGGWSVACTWRRHADHWFTSSDGRTWKDEVCSVEPPANWHYVGEHFLLHAFADGSPALIAPGSSHKELQDSILRFALDQQRHWVLRDQSPAHARPRRDNYVFSLQAVGAGQVEIIGDRGVGRRWRPGEAVQPVAGPMVKNGNVVTAVGPQGTLMLLAVDGGWWAAGDPAADQPVASEPQVVYEKPQAAPPSAPSAPVASTGAAGPVTNTPLVPALPAAAPAVPAPAIPSASPAPASPADAAPAPKRGGGGRSLAVGVGVALLLIAGIIGVWWTMRRRPEGNA